MEISITHNKKQIPLSNLLVNCISARSTPQILSIKDHCIFCLLNFLIIGLYNSLADSWFNKLAISTPPTFYQKIYAPLKQDLFDIHHILDF